MEETKNEENQAIEKRKEKITKWLKNPYNLTFVIILAIAFIIRLYFFILTKNQAVWWDEAQYLLNSKIAFGIENFNAEWIVERPALIYVIYGALFKIGFHEAAIRFIIILFSLTGITAVYLLGKEMFNEKVGLFAVALQTVFWQDLFLSQRFLLEIPSMAFGLLGVYFFWKGYAKKQIKNYWIPTGLFLGLASITRHTATLFLIAIIFYLFFVERFRFLKKKDLWKSLSIIALLWILSVTFTIFRSRGNWFSKYLFNKNVEGLGGVLAESTRMGFAGIFNYLKMIPTTYFSGFNGIIGWLILVAFIYTILKIALMADVIIKSKNHENSKEVLLLIWIIINIIFFGYFVSLLEARYLMYAFPPLFMLLGSDMLQLKKFINSKILAIVAIIIVLIAAFTQLQIANQIIMLKAGSYMQVKESGLWIKENSEPGDIIFSKSVPHHQYYASREVMYEKSSNESETIDYIKEMKPKYLVLSIFEIHQPWIFSWPERYKEVFIPVNVYPLAENQNQPALIIYEINYSNIDKFK